MKAEIKEQTKIVDLTKILKPYAKNRLWVALSDDRKSVMGSGRTPLKAIANAKERGVKEPAVLRARFDYSNLAPYCVDILKL